MGPKEWYKRNNCSARDIKEESHNLRRVKCQIVKYKNTLKKEDGNRLLKGKRKPQREIKNSQSDLTGLEIDPEHFTTF